MRKGHGVQYNKSGRAQQQKTGLGTAPLGTGGPCACLLPCLFRGGRREGWMEKMARCMSGVRRCWLGLALLNLNFRRWWRVWEVCFWTGRSPSFLLASNMCVYRVPNFCVKYLANPSATVVIQGFLASLPSPSRHRSHPFVSQSEVGRTSDLAHARKPDEITPSPSRHQSTTNTKPTPCFVAVSDPRMPPTRFGSDGWAGDSPSPLPSPPREGEGD